MKIARHRQLIAAIALCIAAIGLTACGSSSESGSSSGMSAKELKPLETAVTAGQARTKWEGPSQPTKAPHSGLMTVISCNQALEGCKREAQGAVEAAEALGWQAHNVNVSDPSGYSAAVSQAVNAGSTGIVLASVDQSFIREGLAAAKAKNIPVVSTLQANVPGPNGVDADVTPDGAAMGKLLADYMITLTKGRVDLAPFQDKEYVFDVNIVNGASEEVSEKCPGCNVLEDTNFTSNDVTNRLQELTVSLLQRNPEVNSIVAPYDPAAQFQVPAIKNAGLAKKVQMYSQLGNEVNLEFIRKGEVQVADIGVPEEWAGWAAVDEVIRIGNGEEPVEENIPFKLLTKDNLPGTGEGYTGDGVDYEGEYLKLWGRK